MMGIVIGSCMSQDTPPSNVNDGSVQSVRQGEPAPAETATEDPEAPEDATLTSSLRRTQQQFVFVPDLQNNLRDRHTRRLLYGIKCPMCSKFVLPDDIECHLVVCITKPRLTYNEDVLVEGKGECVICLEDLEKGQLIARLPCLCVYHKNCIDQWFVVNRSCPEHPSE